MPARSPREETKLSRWTHGVRRKWNGLRARSRSLSSGHDDASMGWMTALVAVAVIGQLVALVATGALHLDLAREEGLEERIAMLEIKRAQAEAALEGIEASIGSERRTLAELGAQVTMQRQAVAAGEEKRAALDQSVGGLEATQRTLRDRIVALQQSADTLVAQEQLLKAGVLELTDEHGRLTEMLTQAQAAKVDAQARQHDAQRSSQRLTEKLRSQEAEIEAARQAWLGVMDNLEKARASLSATAVELSGTKARLAATVGEHELVDGEVESLEARKKALSGEVEVLRGSEAEARERALAAQASLSEQQRQLNEVEAKVAAGRSELARLQAAITAAKVKSNVQGSGGENVPQGTDQQKQPNAGGGGDTSGQVDNEPEVTTQAEPVGVPE